MVNQDQTQQLEQEVSCAIQEDYALRIEGANSKSFYGNHASNQQGNPESSMNLKTLTTQNHRGIINYEPSELVITVRSGTPLSELQQCLAEQGQMLLFEPPGFATEATIGGVMACGFSGPRRPYLGAARDAVLGCKLLNGKAEVLAFGGEVMKNVAGYDVSRLTVGAMGTLGVLLELSMKVLPVPEKEVTLMEAMPAEEAIYQMNQYAAKPFPLSAAAYDGECLALRLSGSALAVDAACTKLKGDIVAQGASFWSAVNEQSHEFFNDAVNDESPLWRLSLAPATAPLTLEGDCFYDWGGAIRWLKTDQPAEVIRSEVAKQGGHATLFRGQAAYKRLHPDFPLNVFHPLSESMLTVHRRLKQAFDPKGLFNPGRFHADIY